MACPPRHGSLVLPTCLGLNKRHYSSLTIRITITTSHQKTNGASTQPRKDPWEAAAEKGRKQDQEAPLRQTHTHTHTHTHSDIPSLISCTHTIGQVSSY